MRRPPGIWFGVLWVLAVGQDELHACASCFGASDSAMAQGMNVGILALLSVIGFVLAGIVGFAVLIARRSARHTRAQAAGAAVHLDTDVETAARLLRAVEQSKSTHGLLRRLV